MSVAGITPVGGGADGTVGSGIAAAGVAARVAELRALIAQVETGATPGRSGFGAELAAATAVGGGPAVGAAAATGPTGVPAAGGALNPAVPFAAEIEAAAAKYGIDPALLAGVIKAESNFDPTAGSPAGAQGLTQLMPETASSLGVDPSDPLQAIEGGARVLREHLDSFGDPELALAAYNAGPGAVQEHGGIPPYSETQAYVPRVLGFAEEFRQGAVR